MRPAPARAAAIASRDRYEALIAKTRITAPIDGVVTARHVHARRDGRGRTPGSSPSPTCRGSGSRPRSTSTTPAASRWAPRSRSSPRDSPGRRWRGSVEEIPDTVVGRRLRPEDPGRPIDSRVLPVKIAFGEPTPLKLGQRVEVELAQDVGAGP